MNTIKFLAGFLLLGITQTKAQQIFLYRFFAYDYSVKSHYNKPLPEIKSDNSGRFFTSSGDSTFSINFEIRSDYKKHNSHPDTYEGAIGDVYGVFVNGRKEGLWKRSSGASLLREDTYREGLLHGVSRVFSLKGDLLYQTIFVNGTGDYKEYCHYFYNDSTVLFMEGRLQGGKREGEWKFYFKTGALSHIETYKDGLLHGPYKVFNQEGEQLYSTMFKEGTGWYKSFKTDMEVWPKEDKLHEEGRLENNLRTGKWAKVSFHGWQTPVIYTPDTPDNKRMHHNLIEAIYDSGGTYYINASDL